MKIFNSIYPILSLSFFILSIWNIVGAILGTVTFTSFLWNYLVWLPTYYLAGSYLVFLIEEKLNQVVSEK